MDKVRKTGGNYVFPNALASALKNISMRTQYEASMLSIVFILGGILFGTFYGVFFVEASIVVKVMGIVNALAGFVFLTSMLATTYQQYYSYLGISGLLNEGGEC